MSENFWPKIQTEELQIVDSDGKARIRLSALHGTPLVELLKPDGTGRLAQTGRRRSPVALAQQFGLRRSDGRCRDR